MGHHEDDYDECIRDDLREKDLRGEKALLVEKRVWKWLIRNRDPNTDRRNERRREERVYGRASGRMIVFLTDSMTAITSLHTENAHLIHTIQKTGLSLLSLRPLLFPVLFTASRQNNPPAFPALQTAPLCTEATFGCGPPLGVVKVD